MAEDEIPPQVRALISAHIPSVAQLEILLLLKTNPSQSWTASAIARELRVDTRAVAGQLAALEGSGLIVRLSPAPPEEPGYRYGPKTESLDQAVVALAQAYLVRRVTVIGLIFSRSTDVIRAFSDAFRLRRDDTHG